jgi:flagellar basal body-associated protein FliL
MQIKRELVLNLTELCAKQTINLSMNKKILYLIALIVLLAGAIAAYFYYQTKETQPYVETIPRQALELQPIVPATPETPPRQVLETPSHTIELPQLGSSDHFMTNALSNLLENKTLMNIFINDQLIRNIVVTIDNLPRQQVSMKVMPIKKAPGKFITTENDGVLTISPDNSERYTPYMRFADEIDPKKLVNLYVHLYPLFQKTYEEVGYPDQYFNDRLIVALDNLLAAPSITEPVQLVQPKFFYQFADSELEDRSIGQKILMRVGNENAQLIKNQLKKIKNELQLRMHDERVEGVS